VVLLQVVIRFLFALPPHSLQAIRTSRHALRSPAAWAAALKRVTAEAAHSSPTDIWARLASPSGFAVQLNAAMESPPPEPLQGGRQKSFPNYTPMRPATPSTDEKSRLWPGSEPGRHLPSDLGDGGLPAPSPAQLNRPRPRKRRRNATQASTRPGSDMRSLPLRKPRAPNSAAPIGSRPWLHRNVTRGTGKAEMWRFHAAVLEPAQRQNRARTGARSMAGRKSARGTAAIPKRRSPIPTMSTPPAPEMASTEAEGISFPAQPAATAIPPW